MLDVSFLPAEWQGVAAAVFVLSMAIFAAWARFFGKKEGPPAPKVQEFYAAGQLADMGPVKELVEGVGLLMQQMVRNNIAQEATAKELDRVAHIFEARLEEERRDREIAEEVARQLKEKR
jgi:hypothetical protein